MTGKRTMNLDGLIAAEAQRYRSACKLGEPNLFLFINKRSIWKKCRCIRLVSTYPLTYLFICMEQMFIKHKFVTMLHFKDTIMSK